METYQKSTAGKALGIAGFVLGIMALLLSFIPYIGVIAIIPGGMGIIFSAVGIVQATRNNGRNGLLLAALIVSIIAVMMASVWGHNLAEKVKHHKHAFELFENTNTTYNNSDSTLENLDSIGNRLERRLDSLGNIDVTINIDDSPLSVSDKKKVEESVKKAGSEIRHAVRDFIRDLKDVRKK
ncbi:MAG: hypothetical protein NTW49_07835 [Bacteroidia bacterium]|nr:hypothetical protein [Bacteroidia bacterium]